MVERPICDGGLLAITLFAAAVAELTMPPASRYSALPILIFLWMGVKPELFSLTIHSHSNEKGWYSTTSSLLITTLTHSSNSPASQTTDNSNQQNCCLILRFNIHLLPMVYMLVSVSGQSCTTSGAALLVILGSYPEFCVRGHLQWRNLRTKKTLVYFKPPAVHKGHLRFSKKPKTPFTSIVLSLPL